MSEERCLTFEDRISPKSKPSVENLTFEDRILRLKTKSKLSEADHEAQKTSTTPVSPNFAGQTTSEVPKLQNFFAEIAPEIEK